MLVGPFSIPSIHKLEPVFQEKAKEVSLLFDRAISAGTDGKTGVINATDVFTKFTVDIIGKTTLGTDLGNLTSTTFERQDDQVPNSGQKEYTFHQAYEAIFAQGTLGNALTFANGYLPLRWLPLKVNREYVFATSWLNDVILSLIRERKSMVSASRSENSGQNGPLSRDLITFLVEESMPGGPAEGISEEHFLGHVSWLKPFLPQHRRSQTIP
jgi:hypothetical protein